ncbi:Xenotropic and polytropic retrovirus receptor 1 [Seminavis robusta]|uniref:Xenotropic and polytropic retrovirus receptor 1 n=1 Tax=Seminavis robusta TaxID=568900 RepID=A0A9N8HNE5_9STRA|nr:Xenotropic and polytropic retrovirus receptor 1 [Seminavis robusta]|eukprot:Sro987_g228270.1 Xenotropic and polytropic retrovirus receptor 1 (516) ;mRNA; r:28417-30408
MSSTQEVGEIFGEGSGPAHAMLRSPTILIASVGFWGLNILIFRIFRINYVKVLQYDLKKLKKDEDAELVSHQEETTSDDSSPDNTNTNKIIGKASSSEGSTVATSSNSSTFSGDNNNNGDDDEDHHHHHHHHTDMSPSGTVVYDAITWNRLVSFSASLLFLLHFTTYFWMEVLGGGFIGAIFSFYGSVITVILLPIPSLQWLRKGCAIAFHRTFELVNPRCHCLKKTDPAAIPRPIPFVDVYFADAMCSLSKVFFDMGMLLHMLSHYPEPVPPSIHNIVIPSACAAVPYLIRARQCLVMHTVGKLQNDPKRRQHIQNAIKYSTSLWPLFLSAYQKCIAPDKAAELETLLVFLLIINASYSLYWDIVMDWGMMQDPTKVAACAGGVYPVGEGLAEKPQTDCTHVLLRPRLRFGLGISLTILITDAILRFSWALRFYHALFPSADAFVLFTQFLEVFRRAIWNLLRVEWENIKQQKAQMEKEQEPAVAEDEESSAFLPPASLPMTVPAKRPNSSTTA